MPSYIICIIRGSSSASVNKAGGGQTKVCDIFDELDGNGYIWASASSHLLASLDCCQYCVPHCLYACSSSLFGIFFYYLLLPGLTDLEISHLCQLRFMCKISALSLSNNNNSACMHFIPGCELPQINILKISSSHLLKLGYDILVAWP